MMALTWSAILRTPPMSGPITRNCTGYGTGGPFGSSLTRPRSCGNCDFSRPMISCRTSSRVSSEVGITMACATLVCGRIWSSGR